MVTKKILLFLLRHRNKLKPDLNLLYEASLYAYDLKDSDREFYNYVNDIVSEYKGVSILKQRCYKFSDKLIKRLRYGRKRKYYTKEYISCKNRVIIILVVTLLLMMLVSYVICLSFTSSKLTGTFLADMTLIWMLFSILYSNSIDFKGQKQVVYSPYYGKNVLQMGNIWNNVLGVSEIVDLSITKDIPDLLNQLITLELQRRNLYLGGKK